MKRSEILFGRDAILKLRSSRVAVFGLGGVGGYVVEALARAGIGTLDLVDKDRVDITNINRQIIALTSTIGRYKTDVAMERVREIDPAIKVNLHRVFFLPDSSHEFDMGEYDYIVDAIDTVSGKIELIVKAKEKAVPIISCMGAGNKTDPTAFELADIYKTSVCPLAKVMRRELKLRGVDSLKVVYSKEPPLKSKPPGSNSFVPPVAGLIMAGEVIKDLIGG
ncbi:MAG: tRNA threonylcarbamoyladenosine dehydratase [Lachnospiraceae bacterium]|nr:tRNA threonylcarbamoyladenosine dehydratase [Lachnospiraceae bacterium]